jgi:hypothetical protein
MSDDSEDPLYRGCPVITTELLNIEQIGQPYLTIKTTALPKFPINIVPITLKCSIEDVLLITHKLKFNWHLKIGLTTWALMVLSHHS